MQGISTRSRILDVGCGNPPLFLAEVDFAEKFGLDSNAAAGTYPAGQIHTACFDICGAQPLPFADAFFDAITMLACIEHIPKKQMALFGAQLFRVLKPGGRLIITTPAPWAHRLLTVMAAFGLVSRQEIKEHCAIYSARNLRQTVMEAGFAGAGIKQGTFELAANLWIRAEI
jgi:ubiquinone/menaquinone biosynthesis C-methylase UbiE